MTKEYELTLKIGKKRCGSPSEHREARNGDCCFEFALAVAPTLTEWTSKNDEEA